MARRSASVLPWYHWNMYSRCRHFSQVPQSQDRGRPTFFTAPPSIKRDVIVALKPGGSGGLGERLVTRLGLRPQELHVIGDDLHLAALLAILLPGLPTQPPLDCHLPTLGEVRGAVLAHLSPHIHVEEVGPLDVLAILLDALVHSHAELADAVLSGLSRLGVAC